ncbi:MAG: dicarboxylate/amino acid:cation symporter [Planctomycetota bacterium]
MTSPLSAIRALALRGNRLALHWWILLAMVLGVGLGLVAVALGAGETASSWIKPFGTLFLNLLKMIAVPLVLFSLVAGVAGLNDTSRLSRIGGKTIALYLATTALAISIGLVAVNVIRPGSNLSPEVRRSIQQSLVAEFGKEAGEKIGAAHSVDMVQQLLGIVPTNPFTALASSEMLQIVFFALMLGIGITRLGKDRAARLVEVFASLSDAVIAIVHLIMKLAPIGVFALLFAVVADLGKDSARLGELLQALALYMVAVLVGLATHLVVVYGLILRFLARVPFGGFLKAMAPAQLLAFSSSSSAATLPVTIECVEERVGVHEEISSFVLPLGATVNMDGTGLYQGVAAVFIATLYNMDLSLAQQLEIVLTATLASIGTAAVPGVGIVMLTIVLEQLHVPAEGIAIILGVDRPLDMCRTVLNITGDATVATTVAATEGMLRRHGMPAGAEESP